MIARPFSPRVRELRRQVAILNTAKLIFIEHGDQHLTDTLTYYVGVLEKKLHHGAKGYVPARPVVIRRYRSPKYYWGVGFSKGPGFWVAQIGPWIYTTEPPDQE